MRTDYLTSVPRGRLSVTAGAIGSILMVAAGLAGAQSTTPTLPADDGSLTWKGVTLYGIVDLGLQYQTHGAPISDFYPAGSADIVQKNSHHGIFGVTPSNLSQSRVGLSAVEPLGVGDLSAVFRLETFFNPQSGQLSDGPRSLVQNNGRALADQNTNLDSSVAGQAFQQSYLGLSSKQWGTLTFGRQNTILADLIAKYDPNAAAQAFSVIGLSGTTAGAGNTQDRRVDNSLKYVASYLGLFHVGAQYKFNNAYGGSNQLFEVGAGAEYAGLSADVIYSYLRDAISAGALSAAQVTGLTQPTAAGVPALGYPVDKSLTGTISDNKTLTVGVTYNMDFLKFFAGGEYIQYANPKTPLAPGFDDLGYKLAYVNNAAFPHPKQFQVYWAGVKYSPIKALDLTVAYYGYHQNSYGAGANAGCDTTVAGTCSGNLHAASFDVDYRLTKRFDVYAGSMYSTVEDGLGNGYLFSRNDLTTTFGARFRF